MYTILFS